ncbi:class I SAM-dependent methyltransferase [Dokdonella fugitiva]|jgi:SAM-dependent methyltransferase|uniref:class I SAM-dependent methyltransferase n=1 Tax=Dokdonella fugitiva TaxID=328517 RepID=UPI0015FB725C|nr:class I SAM-dependent methyltransferase [Dokdonella fugitiva]MBA8882754.1 SAM-dependent methyltransferase [Dokdonella fugitiva]
MSFKDHFSGHAGAYHEARPTYPEALFDWLASQAPSRDLAWDAGCGNGQASVALARRFARVHATDPSAAQIANAEARPNVDYRVEPAEACSLADASAGLATVAQALHWFDHARYHAEVRRVLVPGGVVAAWAYADCSVAPVVDAAKDRLYVDLTGPYWPPERRYIDEGYRTVPFPFDEIDVPAFDMHVDWTLAQFLAYLRSWSATQRYLAANGEDPVALVEDEITRGWGDPHAVRRVRWDFHLRAGRV